jgi:hypothetical protein
MRFPKYGMTKGKAGIARFGEVLAAHLQNLTHAIEEFRYHVSGDVVVVEGTELGVAGDGTPWPDGEVSQGRFCNVFEFDGAHLRASDLCGSGLHLEPSGPDPSAPAMSHAGIPQTASVPTHSAPNDLKFTTEPPVLSCGACR